MIFCFHIIPHFLIFLVSIFSSLPSNINSADLSILSPAHLGEWLSTSFWIVLFTTASEWWSTFSFLKYSLSFSWDFYLIPVFSLAVSEISLSSPGIFYKYADFDSVRSVGVFLLRFVFHWRILLVKGFWSTSVLFKFHFPCNFFAKF